MAIIYSYPTVTPASGDLIVGTDITGKVTKNFTVGSIVSTEIPTYITGTTNTVPLFTGANNIGNSIITQNTNGDKISVGGNLDLSGPVTSSLSSNGLASINLNVVDSAQGNSPDYFLISLQSSGDGLFYAKTLELGDGESVYGGAVFNIDSPSSKFLFSNGNVGIGTTTPGSKLDVNGDITASKLISSANSAMFVEPSATSYFNHLKVDSVIGSTLSSGVYGWTFEYDTPHASSVTFRFDNDNYRIYSGTGVEVARFTDTGNVGIGTTSPNHKLEVAGNIRITESNNLNFGGTGSIPEWSIKSYNPGLQSNDLVIEDVTTTNAAVKFENGKGVVLPNKTTTQISAISAPDTGAMVYNTTLNTICFYNGTWQKVSHTAM